VKTAAVLAALALAGGMAGVADAAPAFADASQAFKAAVGVCDRSFEGLKSHKAFGAELTATEGFVAAPEAAQATGVRAVSLGLDHMVLVRASLPAAAKGAVYVASGAGQGGLPVCRAVALDAPGAGEAAKALFQAPGSGWTPKTPEQFDTDLALTGRTYGRPFQGEMGVGATFHVAPGEPKNGITALSSFSLARDR